MLLGLINYVRGWVRVEIRGAAIERFLNLCAQNDIAFWDVRRLAPDVVQATVRIQGDVYKRQGLYVLACWPMWTREKPLCRKECCIRAAS